MPQRFNVCVFLSEGRQKRLNEQFFIKWNCSVSSQTKYWVYVFLYRPFNEAIQSHIFCPSSILSWPGHCSNSFNVVNQLAYHAITTALTVVPYPYSHYMPYLEFCHDLKRSNLQSGHVSKVELYDK